MIIAKRSTRSGLDYARVPLVGATADDVFREMTAAGLPITDGLPAAQDWQDVVGENACRSSRSFVRSDADRGWGLICVGLSKAAFQRLSGRFDGASALLQPLYVHDQNGDVVIFGFGWPSNASELVAKAIDADGSYLADD